VQTKKRKMKMGEALVGMKRRGSQLLKQNMMIFVETIKSWCSDSCKHPTRTTAVGGVLRNPDSLPDAGIFDTQI